MTARASRLRALDQSGRSMPMLRSRPFRLLAGGQLVSNVGDGLYAVALPWYVLSHHGGAILLGTVLAAYGIPRTCLIMVGGHLSDRLSPWTVMMAADIGRLGLAGGLAVLATAHRPELLTLAPIAFGLGAGEGLFLPASFAIMPKLVADDQLQSGNALLSASTQLALFAGPALGGAVVAALSSAAGFGLDALSFGVSALTLWRLGATVAARSAGRAAQPIVAAAGDHSVAASDCHGLGDAGPEPSSPRLRTFVRRERVVPLIMAIDIVANLGGAGTSEVALPLFAREHLHTGAGGYGALIASTGIGALAGSLAATRLNRVRRPAVAAGLVFLAQVPLMLCLPLAPGLAIAAAIVALWGGLNMWANLTTQTAFQRWAPPDLIGRLSGLLLTTSYGMFPISVALAGLVVHHYGPGAFFIFAAVTLAATLAWALSQQAFRDFGTRPAAEPSAQPASPDPAAVAPSP
jgi:predicted MFS family arabinose efflux permease